MKKKDDERKLSSLTSRQEEIIRLLVQMESKAITVQAIAEKLEVSKRTILREIPAIENWMEENDFLFSRKPGVGLMIEESKEQLQFILELLGMERVSSKTTKQDRQQYLLATLIFADEPIKSFSLTKELGISESTLYADLDALNEWLSEYKLTIIRRPGVGIYIQGSEFDRRQAMANAIIEYCETERLLHMFSKLDEESFVVSVNPLLAFIDAPLADLVVQIVKRCEDGLNVQYADMGRISLAVRLSVGIYRICSGRTVEESAGISDRISVMAELSMARSVAELVKASIRDSKAMTIEISEAEIDHLAMMIIATRVKRRTRKIDNPLEVMDLHHVIMAMITVVEELTDLSLRNDRVLIEDLSHHVMTMSRRASVDILLAKPEIDDLQEKYPAIYAATEAACKVLGEWIAPYEIRESDRGYIAMHFIAAAIRIEENNQKIVVAVVCPTGIASSRMLASSVRQKFPNLEVRKILSAFELSENDLVRDGIELLISTVKLETSFPCVEVDKILQTHSQVLIQSEIDKITQKRLYEKTSTARVHIPTRIKLKDVRIISAIGTEIIEILDHFDLWEAEIGSTREAVLYATARHMVQNRTDYIKKLEEGFYDREAQGSTFIPGMGIYLLHCKTDVVKHCRFGYMKLKKPVELVEGTLEGVVCMLLPDVENSSMFLDVIGRLSELLVEDSRFLTALKQGDRTGSVRLAEEVLLKYFMQLIN